MDAKILGRRHRYVVRKPEDEEEESKKDKKTVNERVSVMEDFVL